jgi:putative component of membrane protein insertase Oxa1/YidC/SpoIIIJ protein YidD
MLCHPRYVGHERRRIMIKKKIVRCHPKNTKAKGAENMPEVVLAKKKKKKTNKKEEENQCFSNYYIK